MINEKEIASLKHNDYTKKILNRKRLNIRCRIRKGMLKSIKDCSRSFTDFVVRMESIREKPERLALGKVHKKDYR